jgi:hypothetical protein
MSVLVAILVSFIDLLDGRGAILATRISLSPIRK